MRLLLVNCQVYLFGMCCIGENGELRQIWRNVCNSKSISRRETNFCLADSFSLQKFNYVVLIYESGALWQLLRSLCNLEAIKLKKAKLFCG